MQKPGFIVHGASGQNKKIKSEYENTAKIAKLPKKITSRTLIKRQISKGKKFMKMRKISAKKGK